MSDFYAKSSLAMDRQLKVQKLTIPFSVTASATPASVLLSNDEPSVLFLQSQGVNQITAADSIAAAAFANQSPSDSSGQLNILVVVGEKVAKVMQCVVKSRILGTSYSGHIDTGSVSSTGVSISGNMMLSVSGVPSFASTSSDLCLEVEYSVVDGN